MIQFPCKCGQTLRLNDDQAGGLTQCPKCGLLVDVPTLGDLANLGADGTIKLQDSSAASHVHGAKAVAEMHTAFSRHTTNSRGVEKDLRPTEEVFRHVGDEPPAQDSAAEYARLKRAAPKYDPVTGERIRPIELKGMPGIVDAPPQPVIPVVALDDAAPAKLEELVAIPVHPVQPAQPVKPAKPKSLGYAAGRVQGTIGPGTLALELMMPANTIVMFFALLAYIAAGFTTYVLWVGSSLIGIFSLQILNIPMWLVLAHYGSVIEETGPEARDELPRPLRNLSLSEDLINPGTWWATAILICYWPAILCAVPRLPISADVRPMLVGALALAGSLMLPAVLLTVVTGSTLENLRPDRLLGVIFRCGVEYIVSVGTFLAAAMLTGLFLVPPPTMAILLHNPVLVHLREPYFVMPLLTMAVYLGHYFAWHLGLMYRAHHDEFPWIYQRHIPTRRR